MTMLYTQRHLNETRLEGHFLFEASLSTPLDKDPEAPWWRGHEVGATEESYTESFISYHKQLYLVLNPHVPFFRMTMIAKWTSLTPDGRKAVCDPLCGHSIGMRPQKCTSQADSVLNPRDV